MECAKCKRKQEEFPEWKIGETYSGLDFHHNPPEFISNYLKEKWSGEMMWLCRKDHKDLHELIRKIMIKYSTLLKPNNSEHWIWLHILPSKRKEMIEEIIKFTRMWINDRDTE